MNHTDVSLGLSLWLLASWAGWVLTTTSAAAAETGAGVSGSATSPESGAPGRGQIAGSCVPTRPDSLGPFYTPDAPVRTSVGEGYALSGVVRSSRGCRPIAGARVEFWLANPQGEYDDDHRATVISDSGGNFAFQSNFPPGYSNRPPHIHVRITAPGHRTLVTQHYPTAGSRSGVFDLVLTPSP
jgi:protocatechuate 3,4-dioxygenase beta subunit